MFPQSLDVPNEHASPPVLLHRQESCARRWRRRRWRRRMWRRRMWRRRKKRKKRRGYGVRADDVVIVVVNVDVIVCGGGIMVGWNRDPSR